MPAGGRHDACKNGEMSDSPRLPRSSRCVLVVDDNKDTASTLAFLVQTFGHEAHMAHDGDSAIQLALRVRPDILLLDIGLPGVDGFSVAKRLRQEAALAGMKIIAMTGRAAEDDADRANGAGIDHQLLKPVEPRFLESLLKP